MQHTHVTRHDESMTRQVRCPLHMHQAQTMFSTGIMKSDSKVPWKVINHAQYADK